MKKIMSICVLLSFAAACLFSASADPAEIRQGECPYLDTFFSQEFYAERDLPGEIEFGNPQGDSGILQLLDAQRDNSKPENVKECNLSFLGGDEALKDALQIRQYGNEGGICLSLNYDSLEEPGEAVFDISLRSETYVYRTVKTMRVVSWQEMKLFQTDGTEVTLTVHPGDILYAQEVMSQILREDTTPERIASIEWIWTERYPQAENHFGTALRLMEQGEYNLGLQLGIANVSCRIPVNIRCLSYDIRWTGTAVAGQSVQLRLVDDINGKQVPCRWALENGMGDINDSGRLTISGEVPAGSEVTVIAEPESGESPIRITIPILAPGRMISADDLTMDVGLEGFYVKLPESDEWTAVKGTESQGNYLGTSSKRSQGAAMVKLDCYLGDAKQFTEDAEKAESYYDRSFSELSEQENNLQMKELLIEGHPARLALYEAKTARSDGSGESDFISGGMISYTRNTKVLFLRLNLYNPTEDYVSFADLETLAGLVSYHAEEASFREEDTAFEISARDGTHVISAGRSLNMDAAFRHPEFMNATNKNDGIIWEVVDAENGEMTEAAHMNRNNLITKGDLSKTVRLAVTARSEAFPEQTGSYEVTVIPQCMGIRTDAKEVSLWLGDGEKGKIQATPAPEGFPTEWLSFEMEDEQIARVTPMGEGTAEIEGLRQGRTTLRISEPGGRSTGVTVRVKQPVELLDFEVRGNARPGKTLNLKARIYPEDAAEKEVVWSTDADKAIVTLKKDGSMKISKKALPGTEITITCTAKGAPEELVCSKKIIVEE